MYAMPDVEDDGGEARGAVLVAVIEQPRSFWIDGTDAE
jgi:hypothetical protein